MNYHIILVAFSSSEAAKKVHNNLLERVETRFPQAEVHGCFPPRRSRTSRGALLTEEPRSLAELLDSLDLWPGDRVVVQSLHIIPGREFHDLVLEARRTAVIVQFGLPLLSTPTDHARLADCLGPVIDAKPQSAVLVLGHGTAHPSWTVYPAFQQVLRHRYGSRVFVAALEKYPHSSGLIDRIGDAGFTRVLVIPLLMVAGFHFFRDIMGQTPSSWQVRLENRQIRVDFHESGLGTLPGVADMFCDHIQAVMDGWEL